MTVSSNIIAHDWVPGSAMLAESMAGLVALAAADLVVTTPDGTVQVPGTDYEVTGNLRTGAGSIRTLRAYPVGQVLTVRRATPRMQAADIAPHLPLPAESVEAELDRQALIDQEQDAVLDRALLVPWGETAAVLPGEAERAGKVLGFNAGGQPVPVAVSGATDPGLRGDLANTALGASLVAISHSTPGTAGTLAARWRYEIWVNDAPFGAVGDGSTNDAVAVQAAVDYAETLNNGALVRFAPGRYVLNNTVHVLKSGVTLDGAGSQATWILNGQTNAPAIKFGDGAATYNRNGISNIVFGQKSGVVAVAGNCGLYVSKCSNFVAANVQVFQFDTLLYDGVVFDAVTQSYLDIIGIQGVTNKALRLFNQTFDIYMTSGRCDSSAYGVEIRDCQGIYAANWACFGNSKNAWMFTTSGSTDNNQFIFLTNCVGDTSGEHNWKIEQLSLSTLTSCWAATQQVPITGGAWDGFNVEGADCEDITFTGCIAISNNRHGLHIINGNRIQINGGMYGSNFKPSAFGGLGARNGLSGAGSGIYLGAVTRVSIKGGAKFENNASYGVDISSSAQQVEVNDNEFRFNITGAYRNLANATVANVRLKDNAGINPVGFLAAPAMPASGIGYTNLSGFDCMVYVAGGTVSNIQIDGHGVVGATPATIFVAAGETITPTYSSAPSWQWRAL